MIELWHDSKLRCKPDKVVVKLYQDGVFVDSINIPSVMYPLNGKYELFDFNRCEVVTDQQVLDIFDAQDYRVGYCYSNSEKLTEALIDAGYDAKMYVGWLFFNGRTQPIHHAWTVLDGVCVLDLADDHFLQAANAEKFAMAKSKEEGRELTVSFMQWATEFPHSKRCAPVGTPATNLLYVGCECDKMHGISIYNNLINAFPDHPCYSRHTRKDGLTETQALYYERTKEKKEK